MPLILRSTSAGSRFFSIGIVASGFAATTGTVLFVSDDASARYGVGRAERGYHDRHNRRMRVSRDLEVFRAILAPVRDDVERHLGAFAQFAEAGLPDGRDLYLLRAKYR
jgi:hypothetical protein